MIDYRDMKRGRIRVNEITGGSSKENHSMKTLNEIKEMFARYEDELRERFKVREISIFDSYVRSQQKEGGDLDILVEFYEPVGLEYFELQDFLEDE